MANTTAMQSKVKVTINVYDGTVLTRSISTQKTTSVAGDNSEAKCERFVIASGTADTTLSFGNMASVDDLTLIFSEPVDAIYLSTIVGDELIGVGCSSFKASGLGSEALVHIDATSTSADVTCDMFALSNE